MANSRPTKIEFTAKMGEKDTQLLIHRPNMPQQREGQKVYNRAFNDAISSGALLRAKLDDFMRKQNMWDDDKQERMTRLGKDALELEKALAKGGIKLTAAKKKALALRVLRNQVRDLISERTELDIHTAEGQADNARFNYWVSACLVYNDDKKKPVFESIDSYLESQTDEYAAEAATKLAQLLYNLSADYEDKLEENQFLRRFGFADDQNRLVNSDGHLIDEKDRLVNEDNELVNKDGQKVDLDGNPLDEDGNYDFDRKPFLDDEDNPIADCPDGKCSVDSEPEAVATENDS